MTTAELLGKVAQKCYEITQVGEYDLEFNLHLQVNKYSIYHHENGNLVYITIGAEITKENLLISLKKLENIDETYKELTE